MFHPVGPQPPAIYWRRRFLLFASLIALAVLIVLTVHAVRSDGEGKPTGQPAAATGAPTPSPSTTAAPSTPSPTSHPATASTSAGRSTGKSTPRSSSAAPPPACVTKALAIAAVVGKSSYSVGDTPLLQMQVTNKGAKPCVQDLADKQVEMRVYNGESRVWGSHDCQVQPGTELRTLAPRMPVRVAITWSGRTSQPGCNGTRQRVGAGTYTLYTALAGRTGTASQFTIN
ncbi:MAG TPA: hypothetical protein VFU35_03435 [Jatrophihabitans sp.]|nr:hypothetical protein [Jatrophihabitans sp.]